MMDLLKTITTNSTRPLKSNSRKVKAHKEESRKRTIVTHSDSMFLKFNKNKEDLKRRLRRIRGIKVIRVTRKTL